MNFRVIFTRYVAGSKALQKSFVTKVFTDFKKKKSKHWTEQQGETVLRLFKWTQEQVPAYSQFLKKKNFLKKKIKSYEDLKTLPSTSKDEYLRSYPLEKLCNKGELGAEPRVLTATSGSTGLPFYFPRDFVVDLQSSLYHEFFFRNAGIKTSESTLVIVGFGMGVWIGGMITYEAMKTMGVRGYNVSIITPGSNKHEIYAAIKNIGHLYKHIVLCGYPPFLKDLIDEANLVGIDWKTYPSIKVIFAAEMFSEKFRDYIANKLSLKNIFRDTANIYGTADLGTMAQETPLSIFIRRFALRNEAVYKKLFLDASRLPTLAQFNPEFVTFEEINRSIYCTGYSALPLVRYDIGDNGGVYSFDDIKKIFDEEGFNLEKEAEKVGVAYDITELPFVYVYERSDLSTKLYGAIIYPEHIREALQEESLERDLTGRFTLITKHDGNENEYLEINLELDKTKEASDILEANALDLITKSLLKKNTEYAYLAQHMPERVRPMIVFWPHEHPTHFKGAGKQKWVKKEKP